MDHDEDLEAQGKKKETVREDWACYDRADPLIVTVANRNIALDPGSSWVCAPLKTVEESARAIYYTAKVMSNLEILFPP